MKIGRTKRKRGSKGSQHHTIPTRKKDGQKKGRTEGCERKDVKGRMRRKGCEGKDVLGRLEGRKEFRERKEFKGRNLKEGRKEFKGWKKERKKGRRMEGRT